MGGSARNIIVEKLAFLAYRCPRLGCAIFSMVKSSQNLCFSWWGPHTDSQYIDCFQKFHRFFSTFQRPVPLGGSFLDCFSFLEFCVLRSGDPISTQNICIVRSRNLDKKLLVPLWFMFPLWRPCTWCWVLFHFVFFTCAHQSLWCFINIIFIFEIGMDYKL